MEVQEAVTGFESRGTRSRAEFVATLGRRLTTLRSTLHQLEDDPGNRERRDMLLRRVHALASAARVLGFDNVAETLLGAERVLGRSAGGGPIASTDLAEVSRAIDIIPSVAWGAKPQARGEVSEGEEAGVVALGWPLSILVLGPAALQRALTEFDEPLLECEVSEDPDAFRELAQRIGPDVAVIDGDRRGARELLESLSHDALMEPFPVIVVGTFEQPEAASSFVALGAARVLPKPVGPDLLQRAVLEVARSDAGLRGAREPIGDVTVDELALRVNAEIRRGLVESVEHGSESVTVPLGEATDVLAAVWGAVARIREVVTLRSGGDVRYRGGGPEGAVPLAAWTATERKAGERGTRVRQGDGVKLEGRRAVVVDDDPAVVWFLSGLLRTSGVEVAEAHDGLSAREMVFEGTPDLVISDVLMPGMDGFELCRAIKRDVAVRDVPVILLSWKEDLLQRVRELGAGADGYMRKEAAASTVLQRVREVLRPRARVEMRLLSGGEVKGRLDGFTLRLLLELAEKYQPSARISVRDAVYLYELEMRGGRPRCVTRSASDGSFDRGPRVMDALVGVSAGRFVIAPNSAACRDELTGTVAEVLRPRVQRARMAQALLSRDLSKVDAVQVDTDVVSAYLATTPEAGRKLVQRILDGAGPRLLLEEDPTVRATLEAVLLDIARRGAVRSVEVDGKLRELDEPIADEGREVSQPLFTLELSPAPPELGDALSRWEEDANPLPLSRSVTPPPVIASEPPSPAQVFSDEPHTAPGVGPPHIVSDVRMSLPSPVRVPGPEASSDDAAVDSAWDSEPPPSQAESQNAPNTEISGAHPRPSEKAIAASRPTHDSQPEIRVMPPRPGRTLELMDAIFDAEEAPSGGSSAWQPVQQHVALPASAFPSGREEAPSTLTSIADDDEAQIEIAEKEVDEDDEEGQVLIVEAQKQAEDPGPFMVTTLISKDAPPLPDSAPKILPATKKIEFPRREAKPLPEPAQKPTTEVEKPLGMGRILLITLAAAVVSFALVTLIRAFTSAPEPTEAPPTEPSVVAPPPVIPPKAAAPAANTEELDLPPGVPVAADKGLLEVDVGGDFAIYVDGSFMGRGPMRRLTADPGKHELRLRMPDGDNTISVEVKAGRRTRVSLPAPK